MLFIETKGVYFKGKINWLVKCAKKFLPKNSHKNNIFNHYMSLVMRKPDFCICENKDPDQLRGNREADQRLCFRYIDSTIPQLSKSEISRL